MPEEPLKCLEAVYKQWSIWNISVLILSVLTIKKVIDHFTRIKSVKFEFKFPSAIEKGWVSTSKAPKLNETHINCFCPATGQFLGSYDSMTAKDVDRIVKNSKFAAEYWRHSSMKKRIQVLVSLRDYILQHQEELCRLACRDTGKTMVDASLGEILTTLEKLNWTIKHAEKILTKPSYRPGPTNFFMKLYKGSQVVYEPLGVISAIISWNYPFHNLIGPVISSIITGNTIIVKCSEQVVWSSNHFIDLIQSCLIACEVNPNIVQLAYCLPPSKKDDTANYFTSHPDIQHITFIGSQPIAHQILKQAAKSITPVVVELGGKDSFIVLNSLSKSELVPISSIILRGTFQSSGQNCIGIERVIVSSNHYDDLLNILDDCFKQMKLRQGSDIDSNRDIDIGAMISSNRFLHLQELIQDAVDNGARLLHGGSAFAHPLYYEGTYFQPTMIADVTPNMRIANEEIFGPVLLLMKADDTTDAIKKANAPSFGLGNSVFGEYKECKMVSRELKSGNVAINDFATFYVCQLPFGGINGSGYGKFGGEEGLLGICNTKSICYDRLPGIKTRIPPVLDYPTGQSSWKFVNAFITAAYTNSWCQFFASIWKMATSG